MKMFLSGMSPDMISLTFYFWTCSVSKIAPGVRSLAIRGGRLRHPMANDGNCLPYGSVRTLKVVVSMKQHDNAHHRGLRAALAAAGGKLRAAMPAITVTSAALLTAIAATGCRIPTWGPPAPPVFPKVEP